MDKRELELIKELMDKLSDEMEYGEEDFMERLGKKKPDLEVIKVEGKLPLDEEEVEMEESLMPETEEVEEEEEFSPEDELKNRLLKLRE